MRIALLISVCEYNVGARLPYALSKAGFDVIAICPATSLIVLSQYLSWGRAFHGVIGVTRLAELVQEASDRYRIDIVIPCDDLAATCLDTIRARVDEQPAFVAVQQALSEWQGGFSAAARTRSRGVEIARSVGLRTPRQVPLVADSTVASLAELGSPVVVKQDHCDGGSGVLVAATAQEALDAAARFGKRPQVAGEAAIVAQDFIAGRPASVSFCARRGRVLEAFAYVAVHQHPGPTGAASVISVIEDPELLNATCRVAEAFGYSGFGGVDFILPSDGTAPVFLELNARATQTAHLGGLFGADLCRAMACSLAGEPYASAFNADGFPPIALFPREWARDPNSLHLLRSYHDVPWYEPRIAAAAVNLGVPKPT